MLLAFKRVDETTQTKKNENYRKGIFFGNVYNAAQSDSSFSIHE